MRGIQRVLLVQVFVQLVINHVNAFGPGDSYSKSHRLLLMVIKSSISPVQLEREVHVGLSCKKYSGAKRLAMGAIGERVADNVDLGHGCTAGPSSLPSKLECIVLLALSTQIPGHILVALQAIDDNVQKETAALSRLAFQLGNTMWLMI